MARRRVRGSLKDENGAIIGICNKGTPWSPVIRDEAIAQIELGIHSYYVQEGGGPASEVRVVDGPTGKYLRTDRDPNPANNLINLPDCRRVRPPPGGAGP